MRKLIPILSMLVAAAAVVAVLVPENGRQWLHAQPKSRSDRSVNVKAVQSVNTRAERAEEQFVRGLAELAREYEQLGELRKAKETLQKIQKVDSSVPGVKEKIKSIDETILSANELEFEFDVSGGWSGPVVQVTKGQAVRLEAEGSYRFIASANVGPAGFPAKNPAQGEMAKDVACGALMGLVLDEKKKPGNAFAIGEKTEFSPKQDGLLFLRVNVPPGHDSKGSLRVKLSGHIAPASSRGGK